MSDTEENGVNGDGVIVDSAAYLDGLAKMRGDLPVWMVQLSRAIVRDCVGPGTYKIEFTVESDKKRIKTAVISRVEDIRRFEVG